MAIFISTMILLFAFATNVGMLVHAKINLQNAADAAAYAGAAVQARQMTAIAYLNYEMRRSVKQFMFNYMVRGNRAQSCFPIDENGNTISSLCNGRVRPPRDRYSFGFFDPRPGEANEADVDFLPTVCIIFDQNNNYCQKNLVSGIPQLGGVSGVLAFVNPIIQAVRNSTQIIIQRKIDNCLEKAQMNRQYLTAWLFNLDPMPLPIVSGVDVDQAFPTYGNLDALGVLVRQATLRARIDNFEESLNMVLQKEGFSDSTIDGGTINTLRSDPRKEYFERPIQAYLSALNNLPTVDQSNGIFSDVKLTELIPQQSSAPKNPNLENDPVLFRLDDVKDDLRFAASTFSDTVDTLGNLGACKQSRQQMRIPSFPIGVTKDPAVITFYAVNLKANVRLLFSPFGLDGTVTLSAYSAAKPFGARIGKNLNENKDRYIHAIGRAEQNEPIVGAFKQQHQFINLLVADTDKYAETDGFASNGNLGYLRKAAQSFPNGLARAFRLAGAYAPWEVGYYTIPADFDGISRFANNPNYKKPTSPGYFELRAPVAPVKRPGSDLGFLINRIESYFTTAGFLSPGATNDELNTLKAAYLNPANFILFEGFLRSLGQDQSHFIPNPILSDDPELEAFAVRFGRNYTVAGKANQLRQLTAWNTTKSSTTPDLAPAGHELEAGRGRASYSVRFIGFGALAKGGLGSNDGNVNYTDPFARLSAEGDSGQKMLDEIRALKH